MVIDTDVIIRYFTKDDRKKANRFESFLRAGKIAQITDVTFAEVYWTLLSFYKVEKRAILTMLEALIVLPNINANKSVLSSTIDMLRERSISFVDAYTASTARVSDKIILSFDRDFDTISGIKRIEP